ncbi:GNAT family N-acetyltransferase [Paenibacillus oenotherae]|uniref:GNAT family N-acetyltransferase n=1 Tax=Paenibacillus oenotherae TaxID=1435645 RepID=A0ABS7DAN0_9BACL|nr:GNAT family N-acetyltransferase [Paenibacillus oenotherae]MBW7476936.1 GNAT family N-acetyltransferase [Paenibacillus oenotherae]
MYKHIEEIALNSWPSLQTIVQDGWLLRFADGYTKRSNSVSPIYGTCPEEELAAKITEVEQLYEGAGLDTIFKITPFAQPAALAGTLASLGYVEVEPSSVRLLALQQLPEPELECRIESSPSGEWLDNVARMQGLSEGAVSIARQLLSRSRLEQGFAMLYSGGVPVACGLGVIERGLLGLYDIVTDPGCRNQGFGEQLVRHLLQWGRRSGARDCYLLVVQSNLPALNLYKKIGFREIYRYSYWVKQKKGLDMTS